MDTPERLTRLRNGPSDRPMEENMLSGHRSHYQKIPFSMHYGNKQYYYTMLLHMEHILPVNMGRGMD